MITIKRSVLLAAALPLAFAGCTTTNPNAAFDQLGDTVADRTGQHLPWFRDGPENEEIARAIEALLHTNLTAQSAVAITLLNNRALQAEFEELGISQADLAQASRLRNPSFSGFARLPTRRPTVVNFEGELAQDLLDLLTLPARKKIAAQNLEQVRLRIADMVLRTAAEAKAAFYTVQARQQLLKRLEAIMKVNEAGADLSLRQHKAGNITDLELANQAAAFQQAKLEWAKTQAQLRVDRERLNRLLGVWGANTEWKVADELPPIPDQEIGFENLESRAITQRLDLAAARTQLLALASSLSLKRHFRYLPGAAVGVSAEHDLDHSWVVGPTLDLELPVFDQGQPAFARLTEQYRQAQRRLEALAADIRSEVRQARDTTIAARDLTEFYAKIYLPQRIRIVNETLLQYNAMQKGTFELIAAKERELNAEREYTEAWRDYWIARAELEWAVGGRLAAETPANQTTPTEKSKPDHDHEHEQKK